MHFTEWEPYYRQILKDFGYDRRRDEEAARSLDSLLVGRPVPEEELGRALLGREVTVAGNAESLLEEIPGIGEFVVAADEAVSVLREHGREPQILVTDLDGKVEDQVEANARGCVAVIHAHGDNLTALRAWVPRFTGPVVGTTQAAPFGRIRNYGGFTDGDRAVCLAAHFGASPVRLAGFDFERPNAKDADAATKRRKLDWAYILIDAVNSGL